MKTESELKASILVVDDEQIVHESVRRILEDEGFVIDGAFRVDEAINKLGHKRYDLILTDLMLPERSGMDVVKWVADKSPNSGVVMFTGYATVETVVKSMKLGALDYLPKPFTPEELLQTVRTSLEKVREAGLLDEKERIYYEAEKALKTSLDLKEILRLICEGIVQLLRVKGSALLLFKKSDQSLQFTSSCGLSSEYLEKGVLAGNKSIADVFETGKPVVVQETDFDTSLQYPAHARKENIATIYSIPLKVGDQILGFLRIYSEEKRSFEPDAEIVAKFAEQAAYAIENAMAYEKIKREIEDIKTYIAGSGNTNQ